MTYRHYSDKTIIDVARHLGVAPWELEKHPDWISRGQHDMVMRRIDANLENVDKTLATMDARQNAREQGQ